MFVMLKLLGWVVVCCVMLLVFSVVIFSVKLRFFLIFIVILFKFDILVLNWCKVMFFVFCFYIIGVGSVVVVIVVLFVFRIEWCE